LIAGRNVPLGVKKQLKVSERAGLRGIAPFGVRTFLPALLEIAKPGKSLELFFARRLSTSGNLKKGWAILRPSKTIVNIQLRIEFTSSGIV
jgi:hypothetical protein